jgi:hypothetical protein
MQKHITGGIPRWSPTLVLVARFSAYVWQSGRDAQFSLTYGRMYLPASSSSIYNLIQYPCYSETGRLMIPAVGIRVWRA